MGIFKRKPAGAKQKFNPERREFLKRAVRGTAGVAAITTGGILASRNADKIGRAMKVFWGGLKKAGKPLPREPTIEQYIEMRKESERKAVQEQEMRQATKAQSEAIKKRTAEIEKNLYPKFFEQEKKALEGQVQAMYGSKYKLTPEQITDLTAIARQNARVQANILAEKEIYGN